MINGMIIIEITKQSKEYNYNKNHFHSIVDFQIDNLNAIYDLIA
jgi:hypothetical protein